MKQIKRTTLGTLIAFLFVMSSCQKYYFDSGIHDPVYDGSTIEYLKEKTPYFDSTLTVIELAGLKDVLQKENVTFFAPPSSAITHSIIRLNRELRFSGKDTVSQLNQIKVEVWRDNLEQYIFEGKSLLKDYPQRDTVSYVNYPGHNYESYGGKIMNIGVIYEDAGGVEYAGYRQLFLGYIPDLSNPHTGLQNNPVATSDIQTKNGVIHVLTRGKHSFGFRTEKFIDQAISAGIDQATP